jgi:hypothetical protein
MDISNILDASIDFSPSPKATKIALGLRDSELQQVDDQRMERFVRVWCKEVEFYAPALKDITLVFRPSTQNGTDISIVGINKFLQYLHSVITTKKQMKLKLYMDKYAYASDTQLFEFAASMTLIDNLGTMM